VSSLRAGVVPSGVLCLLAAAGLVVSGRASAAFVLTASWAVVIISGLWLERVLRHVLQPGRPRFARSAVWQALGRLAFLGAAAASLYAVRHQVAWEAAAAGITIAVVGWLWVGLSGR
jgi:hypothetical protein